MQRLCATLREARLAGRPIQAVHRHGELLDQFNSLTPCESHDQISFDQANSLIRHLSNQWPGPQEAHNGLMARKDPALSCWMRKEGVEAEPAL
jgi:uncharacterized protein (DUF2249 family)